MRKPRVYLAGPIASQSYAAARSWRSAVALALAGRVECLDPLRDKAGLASVAGPLGVAYDAGGPLLSSRAIVSRDLADVRSADLVLMALPEPSVGTLVELGWATALGRPVVLWLPPGAAESLRLHPFVRELASATVETVGEAVSAVLSFLNLPPLP